MKQRASSAVSAVVCQSRKLFFVFALLLLGSQWAVGQAIDVTNNQVVTVTTTYGTPGAAGSFDVTGNTITGSILVTAPTGFEVAESVAGEYGHTVSVSGSGTTSTILVRVAANAAAGPQSGNIALTNPTDGVTPVDVPTIASTVEKYALTITATGPLKTYGTALSATTGSSFSVSVGTPRNSETITSVTLTPDADGMSTTRAAGLGYKVTPSLATGGGSFLESNYDITYVDYNGTIAKYALTITATGPLKTYGTALSATTGSSFSVSVGTPRNSETITSVTLTPDADGMSTTRAAGLGYKVTPSLATGGGSFLESNYDITYVDYNGTIAKYALTITATGPLKTYGTALSATTGSSFSVSVGTPRNSETITSVTLTPDADGMSTTRAAGLGYKVTPSLATGGGSFLESNYDITYVDYNGTIAKYALTITATGPLKTYGTALSATTGSSFSVSVGTPRNSETITSVTLTPDADGMSTTRAAGLGYKVTPSLATGGGSFLESNYDITYVDYNGTIAKYALTITATGPLKTYGTALSATTGSSFSVSVGTPRNSETITSVTLTPDADGMSTTRAAGLGYKVTPSLATGGGSFLESNYDITYVDYNGTIAKYALTITATGPLKTYGTALSATTGSSFSVSVGTPRNSETITSVTLTPDADGMSTTRAAGLGYKVTPSLATGGGSFLESNYDITYLDYNGTVGKIAIEITATGPTTRIYGTGLTATTGSTFSLTSGTLKSGETITSVTLTPDANGMSTTRAAGLGYKVTPSLATGGGGFLESNYDITYVDYNGTIAKYALTITATGPLKTYGTGLSATTGSSFSVSVGTPRNSETITSVTLTPDADGMSTTRAVGLGYKVTPSLATGGGSFLESNYDITYVDYNGTIAKYALTITATGPLKTYGTALSATTGSSFSVSVGAPRNSETITSVTLTPDADGMSTTRAVGLGYKVTPSLATGGGSFLESNYDITYLDYNGTVGKIAIEITATGPTTRIYGTGLTATTGSTFSLTSGTLKSGETITSVTLTPDANGMSTTRAAGLGYKVTPSLATGGGGFLESNYDITYVDYNGTIAKYALTITATGPTTRVYGTGLSATTGSSFSVSVGTPRNSETITSVTLTPDANGMSTTRAAGLGYKVTPSLATGGGSFLESNYDITYVDYNGTIAKYALTITATGPLKTYGTALSATTGSSFSVSVGTPRNSETITSVTLTPDADGMSTTRAAGLGYKVTPSLATGGGSFLESNYDITYVDYNGTIGKIAIAVTATGPSKAFGVALAEETSTINFSVTGTLKSGESLTSVTLTPDAAGLSAATPAADPYVVTPSLATGTGGFLESNYQITYNAFSGTVGQLAIIITATGPTTRVYGTGLSVGTSTTNFSVSGTFNSGESVTSVTLTPNAAGLSNATAAGAAYVVTPSAATGDGGFLAANYTITYLPYNGTVAKAPLTITATAQPKVYGTALTAQTGGSSFTAGTTQNSNVVTAVDITPDGPGLSATTAATAAYALTPSNATGTGGFLASNYDITYTPYSGTVTPAAITVTATGPTKQYGTALTTGASTTNFSATGAIRSGEAVTGVTLTPNAAGLSATTNAIAGYTVTPSLATGTGGFLASNYNITYTALNGTVTTAPLTITADDRTKTTGATLALGTTAFTPTGLKNGETIGGVTLTSAGAINSAAVGTYPVVASAATGGTFNINNYIVTYTDGSLAVSNSTNANLNALALSTGSLTPGFSAVITAYTVTVPFATTSLTVTPTVDQTNATVKVSDVDVVSDVASQAIPLVVGSNPIAVRVTAQDGTTQKIYSIVVTRSAATDATLSALTTSAGTLIPVFNKDSLSYSITIPNLTTSVTVTPTRTDANATIKVNGTTVTSGTASAPFAAIVGTSSIPVEVTAGDNTTKKTYTVFVTRTDAPVLTLTPTTLAFSATVGTTTPTTTSSFFTISGSDVTGDVNASVASPYQVSKDGIAGWATSLTYGFSAFQSNTTQRVYVRFSPTVVAVGGVNNGTATVTSTNATSKTVALTGTGVSALSSIRTLTALTVGGATLSPTFTANTLNYSSTVAFANTNTAFSATFGQVNQTVTVLGKPLTNGTQSGLFDLAVGINTFPIIVTPQDGSAPATYNITITRQAGNSTVALSTLSISGAALSPAFSPDSLSYKVSYTYGTTSTSVVTTKTSTLQSVKVKGVETSTQSLSASTPVTLAIGENIIPVIVTAQDQSTRTYTIKASRADLIKSNVATLSSISYLTDAASGQVPNFTPTGQSSYSVSVSRLSKTIRISTVVSNPGAMLKLNGVALADNTPSTAVDLGDTPVVFSIEVLATDSATKKTYTVTIKKDVETADLSSIGSNVTSTFAPAFDRAVLTYSATVPNGNATALFAFTPIESTAIITVNGVAYANGTTYTANLNVGANELKVVVKTTNKTQTYIINVTRAASAAADLNSIVSSTGAISPAFNSQVTNYTASVINSVSEVKITPFVTTQGATVTVNGVAVTSGSASAAIALYDNTVNIITTEVTNGSTKKSYILKITRAAKDELIPDGSGNVTVTPTASTVVISSPTQAVTVTIPPPPATPDPTYKPGVDFSSLITTPGEVTLPKTTINSDAANVAIPATTKVVSSDVNWDGVIQAPVITTYDIQSETPKGLISTPGAVITVGSPGIALSFDKAVRLVIPGQAGKSAAMVHGKTYREITRVGTEDSQVAADTQLGVDEAYKMDVAGDLVIWTKAFSTFMTFTSTVDINVAIVAADMATLDADAIKGNNASVDAITTVLTNPLPATLPGGSTVTYASSNAAVVSADGKTVVRPLFGVTPPVVTLTATITKGLITETKAFALTVTPLANQAPTLNVVANQVLCFTTTPQTIALSGITGGPESGQTTTLTVASSNPTLLTGLAVNSTTGVITYTPLNATGGTATITVTVKDNGGSANGGTDTFARTFTITVNPLPVVTIFSTSGFSISKGITTVLNATGGTSYIWANAAGVIGNQNGPTLTVRPAVTTTYTVTATNATGCSTITSVTIIVNEDYKALAASNIMTPNGDGKNDALVIKNLDMYPTNKLTIFDRGGRTVYMKTNYTNDWVGTVDGAPLAEDTYYYVLDFGGTKGQIKGFVSIVRSR